ncbi:MAG TPA: PAS domain-containing protein [Burkholderiales bacterium]|nr:PAS domain-containing protein [Burkholderiales bacterium]
MTVSLRNAPVARAACHGGPVRRQDSAPALFRLLADSALSRAALAACGAAVAVVDAQDTRWPIAYLNPAFERLFGYRECEVGGQALLSLILDRETAPQEQLLDAVHTPQEIRARHKAGRRLSVEIVLGPVHDSGGRLTHWAITFTDCSELARLRAELSMLKTPLRVA